MSPNPSNTFIESNAKPFQLADLSPEALSDLIRQCFTRIGLGEIRKLAMIQGHGDSFAVKNRDAGKNLDTLKRIQGIFQEINQAHGLALSEADIQRGTRDLLRAVIEPEIRDSAGGLVLRGVDVGFHPLGQKVN